MVDRSKQRLALLNWPTSSSLCALQKGVWSKPPQQVHLTHTKCETNEVFILILTPYHAGHSNKPKGHFPPFSFSFKIQILKIIWDIWFDGTPCENSVKMQVVSQSFIYVFIYLLRFALMEERITINILLYKWRHRVGPVVCPHLFLPHRLFSPGWPRPSCNVPGCVWRTSRPAGLSQTQSHSTLITLRAVSALCFNNTPCQLTPHCAKLSRWNSL